MRQVRLNEEIQKAVVVALVNHVSNKKVINPITYGDVCEIVDNRLIPRGVGRYLYPIADVCEAHDLPPITSVVVYAKTGLPGDGFYKNCSTISKHEKRTILKQSLIEVSNCKDWSKLLKHFDIGNKR